jgi:hypothetical protein
MAGSRERLRTWAKFGGEYTAVQCFAMKLCHAMLHAQPQNIIGHWGRLYCPSSLGTEREKCMIATCAREKAGLSEREALIAPLMLLRTLCSVVKMLSCVRSVGAIVHCHQLLGRLSPGSCDTCSARRRSANRQAACKPQQATHVSVALPHIYALIAARLLALPMDYACAVNIRLACINFAGTSLWSA